MFDTLLRTTQSSKESNLTYVIQATQHSENEISTELFVTEKGIQRVPGCT